jgi:hypothetical protein
VSAEIYTINDTGVRRTHIRLPAGTRCRLYNGLSWNHIVIVRDYRRAWYGGPEWPVVRVPEHDIPVMASPEWLRPIDHVTTEPPTDDSQLSLF